MCKVYKVCQKCSMLHQIMACTGTLVRHNYTSRYFDLPSHATAQLERYVATARHICSGFCRVPCLRPFPHSNDTLTHVLLCFAILLSSNCLRTTRCRLNESLWSYLPLELLASLDDYLHPRCWSHSRCPKPFTLDISWLCGVQGQRNVCAD